MNKLHRVTGLLCVLGLSLGMGYWQQQGWAAGQAGNGLRQLLSSATTSKIFGLTHRPASVTGPAIAMATVTVTSLADGAANAANCPHATNCRLRDAIAKAVAGDTISFSVTGTITLNSGALNITKNLTIDGPGAAQLTISGNSASSVFFITSGDTVELNDLTIANGNSSTTGGGISNNGTLTLNNCTLATNRANNGGGGIYNQGSLTITGSTLSGNAAAAGSGGGIFTIAGLVNITGSTLSGNSANIGGGLANAATTVLTGCTLYDNSTTTNGGGIFNQGTLGLTNSTLSGNDAPSGSGGGIYGNSSATSILNNCTLYNNSAANGGGVAAVSGLLQARNAIIAGNNATGSGPDIDGSLNSVGNNLIGNSSGVNIGGDPFSNILNVNARLAPLANYGGPTQTHALLPGSPAIDAGDDCVVQSGGCLSTALVNDQRGLGFVRKVGSAVDIGAFESRGFTLIAASGNNQFTGINTTFTNPLSVNVTSSFGEPTSGGQVRFTPPVSGASATLAGTPAPISNGTATTGTVTANGTGGSYNVVASATGATAVVNFALTNTVTNTAPSFTPAAAISRQLGSSAGTAVTVGTVADAQTPAGALTVTQIGGGTANGITVTGIANTNGAITALVNTSCMATSGTVRFQVTDGSLTGTGDLQVTMTANTGPTLAYTTASVMPGNATTVGPAIGPVDNGSIASIVVQSPGTYTGTISVNSSTGVVSISNAGPLGNHVITLRATDNCGATTDAQLTLSVSSSPPLYRVFSFGINSFGELSIPNDVRSGATAIAAGAYHSLVLKDGRVYAYGYNSNGQVNVPVEAQSGVTAIAAAYNHSLALKNGGVIAWGELGSGIPVAAQSGVTAMAAGDFHGLFLKNGGVIGWGSDSQGQTTIPSAAQSGVTAIAAGDSHSLALKNGGVIGWGYNFEGQVTIPTAAQSGVTAIAAGQRFSLALKNGGVIGWGRNFYGELNIPAAAQSGVIAIAVRDSHSLALKSTGEVISWGQSAPTIPTFAQSGVVAIATGDFHHLVLKPTSPPTITAGTLTRQQGATGSVATIATVIDSETSAESLTVTATTVPAGITVTSITNTSGTITANVTASCAAAVGANTVVLTVTDGDSETDTANLIVNVTANPTPTLVYDSVSVNGGASTTNTPTIATDNGSITGYAVQSSGTYTGSIAVNMSGVVSLSSAAPAGNHSITIRATDNCGATTDAIFTLTVNATATTTTITNAAALSATPTVVGQAYAVNVSVTATTGTPTGMVTVTDGSQSCTITLPATSCNLTSTSPSTTKTITATYHGTTNFGISSATASHRVNKANTTVSVTNISALGTATVVGESYSVTTSLSVQSPGAGTPSGTITVSDGAQSCTITLPAISCNLTSTTPGTKGITAVYNSDANFNGSTSVSAPHPVNKANTTITITNVVTLASTPTVVGQAVAINWSVTVNVPGGLVTALTGNVTVSDDTQSCTAAVSAGTCSITFATAGAKTLTATYTGDTNYNGNTSADATHTVNATATTTTITNAAALSATPTVVGQVYAVNVSVTTAAGTPTGTVTVGDGSQSCTIMLPATSCNLTGTSPGAKTINATYNGDANFGASSATTPHTVNKANTTTVITNTVALGTMTVVGQSYAVDASVSITAPGAGTLSGTIMVSDGSQVCTITLPATSCTLTSTLPGAKTITATYNGDTNFNNSTSIGVSHTINKASTTTVINNAAALGTATVVGQSYSVQASVSITAPGAGTLSGTITVSDGSQTCSITLPATGCNLTSTSPGTKTITATYNGDANFNSSASSGVSHTVNKASTTTAITSDNPEPSTIGQAVIVNFTVTVSAPGGGTPTGNVSVTISGGSETCTGTVASGSCTLTLTYTGARMLTATYTGDANYNGSADTEAHQVDAAATTTTITNAASLSGTPTVVGQAYAVNVSVIATPPGMGTPTGTITVSDGSQSCTITLPATSCNLTSASPGAPKTITATYNGDASFGGSSATTTHAVNKANTTAAILSDTPDPSVVGQSVTVTYSVSVTSPGGGTPTGNVLVSDGVNSCSGAVAAGQCVITLSTPGARMLTATYQGDANYNASPASAGAAHQVNKADTTATITADTPDPSAFGQPVTVNFAVVASAPGSGTPTGNVTVSDGVHSCSGTVAAGSCVLTLTTLGVRTLTANYAGDASYNSSNSVGVAHTVNKAETTTTIVSDNPDSSAVGQSVTVVFTVVATALGVSTPPGNVTVSDGVDACTGSVAAGSCALTLTTPGNRTLTATYAGDANYNDSSDSDPHTVVAPPVIAKAFSPVSTPLGQTSTLTFTITNPATNPVALLGVTFTDNFPNAPNLVVAAPLSVTNTCGGVLQNNSGGALIAGDTGIKLAGVTVGINCTCTVSVNVTPLTAGPFVNITNAVSSSNGGTGNTATATLATNTAPTISSNTIPVNAGGTAANLTIGTVVDPDQPVNTLGLTINGHSTTASSNGVTVSGVTITPAGAVTANISTTCTATSATFNLVITDNENATGTGTLTVTVTPNTPPMLIYLATSVSAGTTAMIAPATGPHDNGALASLAFLSISPNNGGLTVSVNGTTGVVMVTSATQSGNYTVVIRATDNCGLTTEASLALNVACPTISMSPSTLPNGVQGAAYNQTLTGAPSGTAYTFAVSTGSLPPGLVLASNGILSGTPTAGGSYAFGITATGFGGCTGTKSYNLLISGTCATLTVTPATLPGGSMNSHYEQTVNVTGGITPYSFAITAGALPRGLSLNASTGVITGVPTQGGTFSFRVTATGQGGCTGSRQYVVTIGCATLSFTPTTLPNATRNSSYSQTLSVSPAGTYTFSLLIGSLPPGFMLSSAGVLSGMTNQAGTFNFTVKALGNTCQGTKSYTLVISSGAAALAQLADYDGDGKSDPALWSAADGSWRIVRSSDQQAENTRWGTAGDVALLGDYDGDGQSDLAVFRPGDATFYVKRSSNGGFHVKQWGLATDVPVPGDYDGDGLTDIAIFRPSEGNWYVLRSSDQQATVTAWGAGYAPYHDVAVPGDYDGDGRTDLAVFRRATGTWLVKRSSDGAIFAKQWGTATDIPVAGDYDGDGRTDIAVWRGAAGIWYICQSATGDYRTVYWGSANAPFYDFAVPGDYDGDGRTDLAVWRVSERQWYVRQSGPQSLTFKANGQGGDRPVGVQHTP